MMHPLLVPVARLAAWRSRRQQLATPLRDPSYWGARSTDDGCLELDGVGLAGLVTTFGSPLLAVSRGKLRADVDRFQRAVGVAFEDPFVMCSYKTNCIPGVLRELHAGGCGAEVISHYELWLAVKLGVPGDRIVVNGVNKDEAFLEDAVWRGVASINLDEPGEVDLLAGVCRRLGRKARVSLRLKVDRASHFGLRIENGEAEATASRIASEPETLEFVGLHFHELADNDDPEPHAVHLRAALDFAARLRERLGLTTRNLNVGGGYTVPTMKVLSRFEYARQRLLGVPARPPDPTAGSTIDAYMQALARAMDAECSRHRLPRPRLVFEPGRILTSQSHVLLSRVHAIKQSVTGPDFAMTDAGKILTSYPCDYEYHQMFVANRMHAGLQVAYQLMGRLCTAADWLAKQRMLPRLERGDVIAVMDAGAYFTSYSSNFAFPRPAVVMLDQGTVRTLRRAETFEHLVAMDEG